MKSISGTIEEIRIYRSRKKRLMAFVYIQAGEKITEAVIFPQVFPRVINKLKIGQIITAMGYRVKSQETDLFRISKISL